MKVALCVKDYGTLQALVAGQVSTVDARFVDRDICDKAENGLQQLIPYVVFYCMDIDAGKLKFIQYLRPDQTQEGSEERIPGTSSIGFGNQIDSEEGLIFTETVIDKDNITHKRMTLQDIVESAVSIGLRKVQEQLGMDVTNEAEAGVIVDRSQIAFFRSEVPGEENMVRTGIAIPVHVTEEQFNFIKDNSKVREEEIVKIDTLGINIDLIVEQMDITPVLQQVINELVGKYNLEAWSTMMFNYIARKEIAEFLREVSYKDIVALVHGKRAALAQFEAEQLELRRKEQEAQVAVQTGEQINGAVVMDSAVAETTDAAVSTNLDGTVSQEELQATSEAVAETTDDAEQTQG